MTSSEKNYIVATEFSCITKVHLIYVLYVENATSKYTTIFQFHCYPYTLCSSQKETGCIVKVMFLVIVGNPPHVIQ